ncbi:hypothetical protein, partial [Pseudomonas aeruginosa]|uniref:hypothetical protein n=1 Tax=Pseudomonas aeruginosa TaxID=287 RepID=UPI0024B847C9
MGAKTRQHRANRFGRVLHGMTAIHVRANTLINYDHGSEIYLRTPLTVLINRQFFQHTQIRKASKLFHPNLNAKPP